MTTIITTATAVIPDLIFFLNFSTNFKTMNKLLAGFSILLLLFTSCDIKEEGISDTLIIEVGNPYGTQLITNYQVPFSAKNVSGTDLTNAAVFYVNGVEQNSNEIVFDQTGTYEVKASVTLDGQIIESQPYNVNVIAPRHSTKILVEDYTGTWCTNCPRVTYNLEQAVSQNDHIIPAAIHKSRWAGDDPFGFADIQTLTNDYGISQYPTPIINRTLGFVWDETANSLQTELDKSQGLGLAINSNITGNTLNTDISVRFDMDFSKKNLNLVIYLTENHLFADQANGTNYYGGQDPIPDFEHNHTLRAALTGVYGQTIPADETTANAVYHYQFSGNIPSEVSDINNCDIVAFVLDGNDKNAKLINIQKAAIGENKNFD